MEVEHEETSRREGGEVGGELRLGGDFVQSRHGGGGDSGGGLRNQPQSEGKDGGVKRFPVVAKRMI